MKSKHSRHRLKCSIEIEEIIEITSKKIYDLLETIDFSEQILRNPLYKKYSENKFHFYIEMEINRYIKVLNYIVNEINNDKRKLTICDYGCMLPFLPTALSLLGHNVTIVDKYEYYGDEFKNAVTRYCADNNLKIVDIDILVDDFDIIEKSDISLNLAVVEHLNGSPKNLLRKIHGRTKSDGYFIFDVPNIANLLKRIRLLLGHSPLDNYDYYLDAPYPYMGHNREMTVDEVRLLMRATGFDLEKIDTYDFNPYSTVTRKGRFVNLLKPIIPIKNIGECILAVSKVKIDESFDYSNSRY